MNRISMSMANCYGIRQLSHTFEFDGADPKKRAFAIYAPNGLMKSSLAKTLSLHSRGEPPREERFGRDSALELLADGNPMAPDAVFVLGAEIDLTLEPSAASDVLVSPQQKKRYDNLVSTLEKSKSQLIAELQKVSGVKKADLQELVTADSGLDSFEDSIVALAAEQPDPRHSVFRYGTLFDTKTIEIIESREFQQDATAFARRYRELFELDGTIYRRGGFNPHGAETVFRSMEKHHYFAAGHRVLFQGEDAALDHQAVTARLSRLNRAVEEDAALVSLKNMLTRNAQSQEFVALLERLSAHEIDYLISQLETDRRGGFRQALWVTHLRACPSVMNFIDGYLEIRDELREIELAAREHIGTWAAAIELYNDRFIGLPFELEIANRKEAVLGLEVARLKFVFRDGSERAEGTPDQFSTLSQGERRALYLLELILEVERRRKLDHPTLFVIDDPADSFDYKNKIAILQYLEDLILVPRFRSIFLTHNFDFFRSLSYMLHYNNCLVAEVPESNDDTSPILRLNNARGIRNYFVGEIHSKIWKSDLSLCAAIPFFRTLVEHTRGTQDSDYKLLCRVLHWNPDSRDVTVADLVGVYNRLFGRDQAASRSESIIDIIIDTASRIHNSVGNQGFKLEEKLILSMAIWLEGERYLASRLPALQEVDHEQWTFGRSVNQFCEDFEDQHAARVLRRAVLAVSSNIHLNAFMYEPIVDLGLDHLLSLFQAVRELTAEIPS